MEIIWSDLAIDSLTDILKYVEAFFGKRIAQNTTKKILEFVSSLSTCPTMGKRLKFLSQYGEIRCAYYKQNHIYYQIIDNRIEILIIWDGRQDPNKLRFLLINFLSKIN